MNNMKDVRTLRFQTGLSQAAFAARYNIPLRTIEDWESNKRTPPAYVIELLEYKIRKENSK